VFQKNFYVCMLRPELSKIIFSFAFYAELSSNVYAKKVLRVFNYAYRTLTRVLHLKILQHNGFLS